MFIEGQAVVLNGDLFVSNNKNTVPTPIVQGQVGPAEEAEDPKAILATMAASAGDSLEHRAAREQVATQFYVEMNPTMRLDQIESQVRGINLRHPVSVVAVPPDGAGENGDIVFQHCYPEGGMGQYFTDDQSATADSLGINDRVECRPTATTPARVAPRVQRVFRARKPVKALRSTTGEIDDTWSIPGEPKHTMGGGTQLFITRPQHQNLTDA
ncbi:MAG: hypothetical protein H0W72_02775 [Planctomycetes bacterium]|nr:hypothetical protein [Planctomycetota bacterium]